jgi:hypothetical protein
MAELPITAITAAASTRVFSIFIPRVQIEHWRGQHRIAAAINGNLRLGQAAMK